MVLSAQDCDTFLAQYGWQYESPTGPTQPYWRTGWQGDERFYPLLIHLNRSFLHFEVPRVCEVGSLGRAGFAALLLELNHEISLAKLSFTEGEGLSLSCDLLTHNLDFETFKHALEILAFYAERLNREIPERLAAAAAATPTH